MTATEPTTRLSPADLATERLDPTACLSSRDRSRARSVRPGAPGRYIEVAGPDQHLLLPLADGALHLGRGLSAGLRLEHPSVSRRHAIIVRRGRGARILDDRSLNGTFVNGRRIEHADLQDGDVIVLGELELRYVEVTPPPRAGIRAPRLLRREGAERELQLARGAWRAQRRVASAAR